MKYLCENIQGCVLGYTQSDEITLVLVDYKNINSDAWFDYEVQKCASIAASMATMAFNKYFCEEVDKWKAKTFPIDYLGYNTGTVSMTDVQLMETYVKAIHKGAMFDARVFNIPKEEVTNLIYWRQLDATRNSIQMVGQANFSHKQLQGKSCVMIKDMLIAEKGIDWDKLPINQQRGSCCIKEDYFEERVVHNAWGSPDEIEGVQRTHWKIDNNIPIFKGEGREYIEKLINF